MPDHLLSADNANVKGTGSLILLIPEECVREAGDYSSAPSHYTVVPALISLDGPPSLSRHRIQS